MSLSILSSSSSNEKMLNLSHRGKSLNPNAAEFVPSSFRSNSENLKQANSTKFVGPESSKEHSLDQFLSKAAQPSDDDAHRFWEHQLPDDITPDFKIFEQDNTTVSENFSIRNLSIDDSTGSSTRTGSSVSFLDHLMGRQYVPLPSSNNNLKAKNGYAIPVQLTDTSAISTDQSKSNAIVGALNSFRSRSLSTGDRDMDTIKLLCMKYPRLSATQIASAFYRGGKDIELVDRFLSKLEDTVELPKSSILYPPMQTRDIGPTSVGTDHSPADISHWRNGSGASSIPTLRSTRLNQLLSSSHAGASEFILRNGYGEPQIASTWLDTGRDAEEANVFLGHGESPDVVQLRDSYHDKQRLAQLLGGGGLEKESALYNLYARAAQEKARETLHRQRATAHTLSLLQGLGQELNNPIDLRGRHVSVESVLHVLDTELGSRRRFARLLGRQLVVTIFARHPLHAGLPAAVSRYLLEHGGLRYSQLEPGLFRVAVP